MLALKYLQDAMGHIEDATGYLNEYTANGKKRAIQSLTSASISLLNALRFLAMETM